MKADKLLDDSSKHPTTHHHTNSPTCPEMITETEVESDIEKDYGEDLGIEDSEVTVLNENDLLFCYLADDGYDADSMEQDGFYPK